MQILQAPLGIQTPLFRSRSPLGDSIGMSMQHRPLRVLQAQRPTRALATAQQFRLGVLSPPLQARALPIADSALNQWDFDWDFDLTIDPEPFEAAALEALPEAVDLEAGLTEVVFPPAPIASVERSPDIAAGTELPPPPISPLSQKPRSRQSTASKSTASKPTAKKPRSPAKTKPGKAESAKTQSGKAQLEEPSAKPSAKSKQQPTQVKTQPKSKTARQPKIPPIDSFETAIKAVEAVEVVEAVEPLSAEAHVLETVEAVELLEQQTSEFAEIAPAKLRGERDRSRHFDLLNDSVEADSINPQVDGLEPQIEENEESIDRATSPVAETKKQKTRSKKTAVQPKRASTRRGSNQHSQKASNQPNLLGTVPTPATVNPDSIAEAEMGEAGDSIALPQQTAQHPQLDRAPHLHQAEQPLPELTPDEDRSFDPQQAPDQAINLVAQPEVDRAPFIEPVLAAEPVPAIETLIKDLPQPIETADLTDTASEPKQPKQQTSQHRQPILDATSKSPEVIPQLNLTQEQVLPIAPEVQPAPSIADQPPEAVTTQPQSKQQLQPTLQLPDALAENVLTEDTSVEAVQTAVDLLSGLLDRDRSPEPEWFSDEAITASTGADEQPIHFHELPTDLSSNLLHLKPDSPLPQAPLPPAAPPEANTPETNTLETNISRIEEFFPDDVPIQGFSVGGAVAPVSLPSATPIAPSDTIPALLTPGEFIINARDAQRHLPILRHINQGGEFESDITADSATDAEMAETPEAEPLSDELAIDTAKVSRQSASVQRKRAPSEGLNLASASPLVEPQALSVFRSLQSGIFDPPETESASTYTAPRRIFRSPAATAPSDAADREWSSVEDLLGMGQGQAASAASFPDVALPLQTVIHRQVQGFAAGGEVADSPDATTAAGTKTIERSDDAHTDNEITTAIESLAQEIYQRLRQRLEIERERQGFYSGRLPW